MKKTTLNECVTHILDHRGLTPKKLGGDWSNNGKYRVISAKNIKNGSLTNLTSIKRVNHELYKRWMLVEIEKKDILITSEAPFGEALIWDSDEKIVLGQRIFGLKVNKDECNPHYLYYWMTGPIFQSELYCRSTGTTVTGLRQPELLKCSVNLPNLDIQEKIANILLRIDKKIQINAQINDYLATWTDLSSKHRFHRITISVAKHLLLLKGIYFRIHYFVCSRLLA